MKDRFPHAHYYDLLQSDLFLRLVASPHILREELVAASEAKSRLVIIDEVQKIPALLDEIHWLIENTDFQFILCGSSARKVRRGGVNLLGGRAWKYHMYPLVYPELPEFDLLKIFNCGTIPAHYDSPSASKALKAYLEDYITMEIQHEGLVRNLPAFSRFLEAIRFSHGQMIVYSNIARDAHVDGKTVKEYFNILVDTLIGYMLFPFAKHVSRQIISETPKFYLFDVGLASHLQKQTHFDLQGSAAGKALEHLLLTELIAYRDMANKHFEINYWRTKSGVEVDFVLDEGRVTVEATVSSQPDHRDLKSTVAFCEEHRTASSYLVCQVPKPRRVNRNGTAIDLLPIEHFLQKLWNHEIV